MRTSAMVIGLLALGLLHGNAATAAPLPSHRVAAPPVMTHTVGHRTYHRTHRHHAKYTHRHGKYRHRHRKCRKGWLPPLKEHRHLPGKWSHKHCGDWHRCHYYFYGYQQYSKWNPDRSRTYFRKRYHH